ncbi:MAG: glycogen-binding domain-containing protein [Balneolaceae bacterium]
MIRRAAMICSAILFSGSAAFGQDWQAAFNLDSRVGYTTNTYLNPFISDWDPSVNTGFGFLAPVARVSMNKNNFSSDMTGGIVYEPMFDGQPSWKGGFGVLGSRYRLTEKLFGGVEAGGSYFSGASEQKLFWMVPVITFSPSLFTQFRLKAGSSFRESSVEEREGYSRFDSYSFELETWPGFNWQLKGGIYGNLDQPANGLSTVISADHLFTTSLRFSVRAGLESYQYQVATETGGGGQPPVGGPRPPGEQISDEADRFFRIGISSTYQVNRSFAVTLNADHLSYFSTVSDEVPTDVHISAGFRYSFSPGPGTKSRAHAEWKQNGSQTIFLRIKGAENGQLYLIGDFNDWEHPGIPLSRQQQNRYAVQLALEPGAYEYKILLIDSSGEETWMELSDDTYTVPDGFDGENGLIFIE